MWCGPSSLLVFCREKVWLNGATILWTCLESFLISPSCMREVVVNSSQRTLQVFELSMNSYSGAVHFLRNWADVANTGDWKKTAPKLKTKHPWRTCCAVYRSYPRSMVDLRKMLFQPGIGWSRPRPKKRELIIFPYTVAISFRSPR